MGKEIRLYFPDAYVEYFDDILIQANKGKGEKEKFKDATSLFIFKIREYISNLYPSYISWLPTKNFNNTKINVSFVPYKIEDLEDVAESESDKLVVLSLTGRTTGKLLTLMSWVNAIQDEINKKTITNKPDVFNFTKPSEFLKNLITESLKPSIKQVEEDERKEEDAEEEADARKTENEKDAK